MVIGVKYCGGCNPVYERKKILKRLLTDYPFIVCEPIKENTKYDLILIICGCRSECSDYSGLSGIFGEIKICDEADYEKIKGFFKDWSDDMEYKYVLVEIQNRLATVTVNRPDVLNSLNGEVIGDIFECLKKINRDFLADCVIITGAGRSFIAGADIGTMVEMDGNEGRDWTKEGMDLMDYIEAMKVPVIAAINGFALGGGCELAMACDIRVASTKAKFSQPETGLGIIPGYGATQRLSRLVGKGMAKYMIFTGEMINAMEAYRIGLVQKVVEPEELMDETLKAANAILSKAPTATRMAKRAINASENTDLATGICYELETYDVAFNTEDRVEGMKAFLEKRKPQFKNK